MSAKFGPGGNSESFYAAGFKSTLQAPGFVRSLGLEAYEYEAGNGIPKNDTMLRAIGEKAAEHGINMSFHTPYYISLSSVEREKRINSVEYLRQSALAASLLGASIMVVHCGSAGKIDRATAMEYAAETLLLADAMLASEGFGVTLGIETMGKVNQLGTLDEVITLCKLSKRFAPVVDFGHLNARGRGCIFGVEDYSKIFDTITEELGFSYADNLHCHFSKIMFTEMGEKKHLTFEDEVYGPEFAPLAVCLKQKGLSPTIICESAGTQSEDALAMKMIYTEA